MSKDINEIKKESTSKLLNSKGVTGVGVGKRWVDGMPTNEDAVLVFVQKKRSKNAIRLMGVDDDIVPEKLNGIPTDVIEVGEIVLHSGYKNRVRPIKPGYSISHGQVTAGTIGGIFIDKDSDVVILSNNHVLANENRARVGDIVYQPGTADTNSRLEFSGWDKPIQDKSYVGTLKDWSKLSNVGNFEHDSAIARIHPDLVNSGFVDTIYPQLEEQLKGFTDGSIGDTVYKCGRTTGFTSNRIISKNSTFKVPYSFGICSFKNIILTNAMSQGGDSGSIGLTNDMKAFGLLFAGSPKVTLFNPIQPVVDQYGLTLMHEKEEIHLNWMGILWTTATTDGTIKNMPDGTLQLIDNAHHHCYIETKEKMTERISAMVSTGDDEGIQWGIGVTLEFPHGQLQINLRCGDRFGATINGILNNTIGNTKPRSVYVIEFIANATHWQGDILTPEGTRIKLIDIPKKMVGQYPTAIRVGKTGDNGGPKDRAPVGDPKAGKVGKCRIIKVDMK